MEALAATQCTSDKLAEICGVMCEEVCCPSMNMHENPGFDGTGCDNMTFVCVMLGSEAWKAPLGEAQPAAEMANGHAEPAVANGHEEPELANGHVEPDPPKNGHAELDLANGHAEPELANGHVELVKPIVNGATTAEPTDQKPVAA
jgi:hypothetical protein